jgi:DivIVA domain-containing protein|nr:DivIVA domain-containing protein [Actinacidiphila soli]
MGHQDSRDTHAEDGGEARVVHVPRKAGCEQPWLTPEDVRGQVFTTVRLREGYDLGEVDSFMGRVESVMSALVRENAGLREQREAAVRAAQQTLPSRNGSAERLMAIAQKVADEAVAEASERAEQIVKEAEARASSIERQVRDHTAGIQREVGGLHEFAAEFFGRLRARLYEQHQAIEAELSRLDAGRQSPDAEPGLGEATVPPQMSHPGVWRSAPVDGHRVVSENWA